MFKFEDVNAYGKEAVEAAVQSYATTTKGFQAIATEAADYSKKSFETGVAHVEKLFSVKSIESAVELQTAFAKSAFEGYVAEMTKIGEMVADMTKQAYKPVEAVAVKTKETVKASVEKAAAAA